MARKKKNSKRSRSQLRGSRLGVESLEHRRVLAVFINELMLEPLFGDNDTDQFVEIRNDDLAPIPANTYLVFVDGDSTEAGNVHTIFNLSGIATGSNGILTVLQQDHPYAVNAAGNAIVSTADGFGGLPAGVFQDTASIGDRIEFIVGSNTAMLIESATAPTIGMDVDDNNDGVIDAGQAGWTILDSISLLENGGVGYSDLVYRAASIGGGGNVNEIMVDGVGYAARTQDSVGQNADDWVVGTVQEVIENGQRLFRVTQGVFGNPEPIWFAGRYIDHVGQSNFHGAFSGQVSDGGPVPNATVYVDINSNGVMDNAAYTVRPEDFVDDQELTNEAPRATLTVGAADGTPSGFKVRSLLDNPSDTIPTVFGSEGIPWFESVAPLRIDFPEPAISITAEFRGSDTTFGRLEVFNADGESLQLVRTSGLATGEMQAITIDRAQADISYALAYSDDDFMNSSPFGTVTELRYQVPEHRDLTNADGNFMIDYLEPGTYEIRVNGTTLSGSPTIGTTEHIRGIHFSLAGNTVTTGHNGGGQNGGGNSNPGQGGETDPLIPGGLSAFLISALEGYSGGTTEGTIVEDGDTLRVSGTIEDDNIHVAAGLTEHVITINDEVHQFDATVFDKIDIHAFAGDDFVTVVGTSLDDQADLLATSGQLVSSNYTITFDSSETISVDGGNGGLDKAILADSAGDDVFLGSSTFASMREINNSYRNEARGFDIITGNSVLGGNDQALVFGTTGSDHLRVLPEFAQLTRGAGNTEFRANKFEQFEARGEGGIDKAEFVDSVGDDHITLQYQQAVMVGAGYQNTASDFDTIFARADRGGTDSATFFDSAGDDTLAIRPASAMYMRGADFENRIWGFDQTEAFADGGGVDESFLYDTAGDDVFVARPTTSNITGTINGEAYEHVTHNFEVMTGHAMYAGIDTALVFDSAGDDTLIVRPDFAEVQGANGSFKHRLLDFQTILADGSAGGNDTAIFLDTSVFSSDPTNDIFTSTPTQASLEQTGTLFRKTAEGYETINAFSTTGTDVAVFSDVESTEQLDGSGNNASIANRNTTVNGFGIVRATNKPGDTPTADIDAVNYVFEQIGQWNNI